MDHTNTLNPAIVQQAKQLALGLYEQQLASTPEQFAPVSDYQQHCVLALNMKDAMELYNENKVSKLGLPPLTYAETLFDVFVHDGLDATLLNDANALAQHFMETLSDTVFFQLKSDTLNNIDQVIAEVKTFSYWSPVWVLLAEQWHDTFNHKLSA
ncbi:hypothetical protein E0H86_08420 [Acinetobacter sp. ANC 4635]|uniref:hypothetical protein n=1 Tax=Acinetobacter sp. ANC 4635 TaxID=2529846 RepID=UPI00103D1599|nr:hypothetical protein [Acinetobacter sp. ANC 4635]TCB31686.1 hypothetical protein E0H86_08420 [Acinetobacter sp. ANC 4635]